MWIFKRQKECNDDRSGWVARSPGWVRLLYFKPDHIAAHHCATHPRLRRLNLKIKQANKCLLQRLHTEFSFKRERKRFWWLWGWRGFSLWTMKAWGTSLTTDMRFTVMMTASRWASSKFNGLIGGPHFWLSFSSNFQFSFSFGLSRFLSY